ncbi:hypothetical protein KIN20_033533 [Parelaphostrongylus tenuis]|uniref:Uncharacterized protein n=1 Tax=Parelaphostrongylus tenuis TaxID=148309 RepID=A0AAD5R862_PARTN|nr:hypothetical protein KIN20_033533 [Parelaphostrongylus tenuis]
MMDTVEINDNLFQASPRALSSIMLRILRLDTHILNLAFAAVTMTTTNTAGPSQPLPEIPVTSATTKRRVAFISSSFKLSYLDSKQSLIMEHILD